MNQNIKRLFTAIAIFVIFLLAIGYAIGNYFYTLALDPAADKSKVLQAPHNQVEWNPAGDSHSQKQAPINPEHWYLESFDHLNLHALAIEQEADSDIWVILCHGYNSESTAMLRSGMHFYEAGSNLLLPDSRGAGLSEGAYIGMGWHDRLDIVDWISKIIDKNPDAQIILYGISMGGATVMMVSGETLPEQVKVIIEDCGYSSAWDEFSYQLNEIFGLPEFPVLFFASATTKIRAGYFLGEADAVRQVAKSTTPMMFIHGDQDTFVPTAMLDQVYNAASVPKEKLLVPGAGHGQSSQVLGAEYWERIDQFIRPYVEGYNDTP